MARHAHISHIPGREPNPLPCNGRATGVLSMSTISRRSPIAGLLLPSRPYPSSQALRSDQYVRCRVHREDGELTYRRRHRFPCTLLSHGTREERSGCASRCGGAYR